MGGNEIDLSLSVYLAGPWADRAQVRAVRDQLVEAGIPVNSRWIDSHHTDEANVTHEDMAIEAWNDIEDVVKSKVLMVWNSQKSEGKAFETGVAIALQKDVIIIGERTNVFHHLPMVIVPDTNEAIKAYRQLEIDHNGR